MTEIDEAIKKIEKIKAALMSDENDSASLQQAYDSLHEIFETRPELADRVLDSFNIGLQSDKNDSASLQHAYFSLQEIVRARPELADKVFDSFNIGLQSSKNNCESLYNAHWFLQEFVNVKPELADKVFDSFNICLQSDENDGASLHNAYVALQRIVAAKPELAVKVMDSFNTGLQSGKNDGASLHLAYNILQEIFMTKPKLADKVFNSFKIGLQSDENDGDSLTAAYESLLEIVTEKPELADKVLDSFNIGIQSDKNNEDSFYYAYYFLQGFVKAKPELADEAFDSFDICLQFDENDSKYAYEVLRDIVEAKPELADKVFNSFNVCLQSDENDGDSLHTAYNTLKEIIMTRPELADKVFDSFNIGLQSDKNDGDSLKAAYRVLKTIVAEKPELADKVFDSVNIGLQSVENDGDSLTAAYSSLQEIVKVKPELTDKVLDSLNICLKSDEDDSDSLTAAYRVLKTIVAEKPELADKVFDSVNIGLQSDENDGVSLKAAYSSLQEIVKVKPELTDKVLDSLNICLKSGKNSCESLKQAYDALCEIAKAKPELTDKVLDYLKIGLQSNKNDRDSLKKAYYVLRTIVAEKPELADKVLDCIASGPQNNQSIYILKTAMKHLPLEETVVKYPKIEENLRVAHKCRFSADDEVRYALQHLSKQKIINSTIMSAQQRTMNILVGEALREAKLDENEKKWYRTPDVSTETAHFLLENNDWLVPTSFRAAGVFGCYFPAFVKTAQKAGFSTSDIENLLPEPMSDEKNQSFRQFMLKHMRYQNAEHQMVARPLADLSIIVKNWKVLKPEDEKGGYQAVLAACKAKKYEDQRDDNFAKEAALHGVTAEQYHNIEDFYLAGLTVPRPFDSSVIFKDKTGKYTARFLPPEDVRIGFFGEYTGCCQSFGGIGDACAVSTVKHPFSQLFVIEREHDSEKDKDKPKEIIAGSWTWENTEGKYREVCFDNIETIGDFSTERLKDLAKEKDQLVETMANRLKDKSDEVKYKAGEHLWEDYFTAIKTLDEIPDKMLLEQKADIKHFKEAEQKLSHYMKRFENDNEDEYFVKQWEKLKATQNEHLNCRKRVITINDIYEQAGEYLAKEQNCRRVTIGRGRQDAQIGNYAETEAIPLPSLYGSGYSDARAQVLLAENPGATPLDKTKECPCYVRRVCFDDTDKMDDISEKCFPKGDRELADVENRAGFVVEDPHRGVVGYVIYDEQDKYISDMAVLKEYRTRKLEKNEPEPTSGGFLIDKSASNKLMFAMFEEIEKTGGTWSAHMRDRTSFKLLEFMEKRGRVKFSAQKEREMSDGSIVYEVSFYPIISEAQKLKDFLHPKEDINDDEQIERTTASRIITHGNSDER